jgi:hypothetical protein
MRLGRRCFIFAALMLHIVNVLALEDEVELAKAAQNVLKINFFTEHIAAPFENDINYGYGTQNETQDILDFKPVIPFRIAPNYDLIIRTIAPLIENTPTANAQHVINGHYISGWGDVNPTFFISPIRFRTIIWGFGPSLVMPTATNNKFIGAGKWSIGPELALYAVPGKWMLGFLTSNIWSVAGNVKRPAVDQFSFQYLVSYVFDKGWYISTNPTMTANWKKAGNQQWVVPLGVGGGRAFYVGTQPMNISMHAYYNAIRPSGIGPNWQLQLQAEWLFKPWTIG